MHVVTQAEIDFLTAKRRVDEERLSVVQREISTLVLERATLEQAIWATTLRSVDLHLQIIAVENPELYAQLTEFLPLGPTAFPTRRRARHA